jgi:hypothetical protein
MLKIAKSNNKTSNNSIRLVVAIFAISVTRIVATTLIINVIATHFKLIYHNAYKAIKSNIASSIT